MILTQKIQDTEYEHIVNSSQYHLVKDADMIKGMYFGIISSKFNTKYNKEISNSFDKDFTVAFDENLGQLVKGSAVVDRGRVYANFGEFATLDKPLAAVNNIRNVYAIIMKGYFRKVLENNTKLNLPALMTSSMAIFVRQMKDFLKKYGKFSYDTLEENLSIDTVLAIFFVMHIVGKNLGFAKIAATNLLKDTYKYEEKLTKPIPFYVDMAINGGLVFDDWTKLFNYFNEDLLPVRVSLNSLVLYFMNNFPMSVTGLDNYANYISDNYAFFKQNAYNAKFALKRYYKEIENFIQVFERTF